MTEILQDHPIVWQVLSGIITLTFIIIGFFIRGYMKSTKERLDKIDKENDELRNNYLDRFDRVEDKFRVLSNEINLHHIDAMEKISKVLAAVESQKEFCALVQEQKKLEMDKRK